MTLMHRLQNFYGFQMMVRFEVDGYLPNDSLKTSSASNKSSVSDVDDLAASLADLSVRPSASSQTPSSPSTSSSAHDGETLRVIQGGREVAQSSIVEFATRSIRTIQRLDWLDDYSKFCLSKTPHFHVGIHERGVYSEIRKRHMDDADIMMHNRKVEGGLQRLGKVLEIIQEIVIEHGPSKNLTLLCEEGVLRVFERQAGERCLPADMLKRFVVD